MEERGTGLGRPRDTTIVRRISVKVGVERWDWTARGYVDTIDITHAVMNYQWQKTIKSPAGGATITLLPQNKYRHYLDDIDVMDVVKITEFGTLKFIGYIKRVATSGWIDQEGKPHRTCALVCTTLGGYLVESMVSVNMSILRDNVAFQQAAVFLAENLAKSGTDPVTYNEAVTLLIQAWQKFIDDTLNAEGVTGASLNTQYFNRYIDFTTAMSESETPGYPRELFLFYGEEDEVTLWSILQKLAEVPLNEFFFDNGPRTVHLNGKDIELQEGKEYLIGRPTPFDGTITVNGGAASSAGNAFSVMPFVTIPNQYLLKFELAKSNEDVYSVYLTAPSIYDMSKLELLAAGKATIDDIAYQKYLYRLCNKPLYYITVLDRTDPGDPDARTDARYSGVRDRAQAVSDTLHNWYTNNDQFLSGVIEYMVPANADIDPRTGQKLKLEGINGFWYIEGITHSWNYKGPLKGSVNVTRGYTSTGRMKLANRIFRKPQSVYRDIDALSREIR